MAFSSAAVANKFIELAAQAGQQLTPMKLQKLVYYAHGWYFAIAGEPLLDELIEAWQYGPVVPSLFHRLKGYGNEAVQESIVQYDLEPGEGFSFTRSTPTIDNSKCSNETKDLAKAVVEKVWREYGGFSAIKLSNMTHAAGSPWHQTWAECGGELPKSKDINPETIQSYFAARLRA